ncbi:hypothetical protein BD770DRAFT_398462 [Pilaira anomala]|nr:hypothetical protein BD770DRAFT_398462 [Pilaira anomala]
MASWDLFAHKENSDLNSPKFSLSWFSCWLFFRTRDVGIFIFAIFAVTTEVISILNLVAHNSIWVVGSVISSIVVVIVDTIENVCISSSFFIDCATC